MKVLYYIDNMPFGGAARKLCLIANELVNREIQVYIATNTHNGIGFPLSEKVHVLELYTKDAYTKGRLFRLRDVIKRSRQIATEVAPDVIVTIIPHVSLYVKIATIGLGIPTIFSDETSFARKDIWIDHFIRHWFYRFGDAITLLTHNDAKILGKKYPQKVVINNPLVYSKFTGENTRENTILAIGPLEEWEIKGFDLLLQAFANLSSKYPEWKIKIAGKIENKGLAKLQQEIIRLNLEGKVEFLDFCPHIDEVMQKASIFALSSRIEGFSLSLVEAISQGCACIAFDIYGVISEVTDGGKGTIIIKDGDIGAYSEELEKLVVSEQLRNKLVREGESIIDKYKIESIVDQWESLFNKLKR